MKFRFHFVNTVSNRVETQTLFNKGELDIWAPRTSDVYRYLDARLLPRYYLQPKVNKSTPLKLHGLMGLLISSTDLPIILDFSRTETNKGTVFAALVDYLNEYASEYRYQEFNFIVEGYRPVSNAHTLMPSYLRIDTKQLFDIHCYSGYKKLHEGFFTGEYEKHATTSEYSHKRNREEFKPAPNPYEGGQKLTPTFEPWKEDMTNNNSPVEITPAPALSTIERKIQKGAFSVIHQTVAFDFLVNPIELHQKHRTLKLEATTVMTHTTDGLAQRRRVYEADILAFPLEPGYSPFNGTIRLLVEYEGKTYFTQIQACVPQQPLNSYGQSPEKQWWLLLISVPNEEIFVEAPSFKSDAVHLL